MTLSPEEAAQALDDLAAAQRRAAALAQYARHGVALMVWGGVWLGANLVSQFAPAWANWAWGVGLAAGFAASAAAGRRRGAGRAGWRFAATFAAIGALVFCAFLVSPPRSAAALDAVISLYVAGAYTLLGVWTGARWVVLGLTLGALVLVGWFLVPAWFFLWMALAGGGGLIVGGLWLRSA